MNRVDNIGAGQDMARASSKNSSSARKSSTRKPTSRKKGTLKATTAMAPTPKPKAVIPAPEQVLERAVAEVAAASEAKAGSEVPSTAAGAPEPVVVAAAEPVVSAPELGKRELIEQVVSRSGIKKRDAKPVVEAVLALLGEAVAEGRELNLKPFGKMRVNRSQERSNGKIYVCKLRQPIAAAAASLENTEQASETLSDPLAEAASDS